MVGAKLSSLERARIIARRLRDAKVWARGEGEGMSECKNCETLKKKVAELEAELNKHRCPICGRIGCMNDHGYGAGGGDWG